MTQTVDPTFYRSPAEAIAAPPERLAYVAAYDRAGQAKDAMAVLDSLGLGEQPPDRRFELVPLEPPDGPALVLPQVRRFAHLESQRPSQQLRGLHRLRLGARHDQLRSVRRHPLGQRRAPSSALGAQPPLRR